MAKPTKKEEFLEKIRARLIDGEEYQCKKEQGEYISVYKNK